MPYKPNPQAARLAESARLAIKTLLLLDIHPSHKRFFVTMGLWKLTEAASQGKYNTRFQSLAAQSALPHLLRHEHVFQRSKLVNALLAQPDRADEILDSAVACVVTVQEHEELDRVSRQSPELDGWDRYRAAMIAVIDLASGHALELL
jgi:hypothetical protein